MGITDATVSRIIERAGLSRGMIHLHFAGKDNLLIAAAQYFNQQYYLEMDRQLAAAGTDPQEVVLAVVRADLSQQLLNERSTKIWHAFRGVASAHPGIAQYSSSQDEQLKSIILKAFRTIAQHYDAADSDLAEDATFGTLALLEGMWVHFRSDMQGFSRDRAYALISRFLNGLFPQHFTARVAR